MNIIKLSAISSTNDYLKELLSSGDIQNFTVVTADVQTGGRGQMGAVWNAEPGKNLTFSLLLKDLITNSAAIFSLNVAIATAIADAVLSFGIADVSVKWPNDILAGNKKIAGILIENSFKSNGEIHSVIGIGLNVNQQNFNGLPKASSMAVAASREFDKNEVLTAVLNSIKQNILKLQDNGAAVLWQDYHDMLFKKGVPMPFEADGNRFMGIIQGVSENGYLQVLLENDTIVEYGLKEIQLLY
ncbi:biotin--[acetyl-CoA-carboxylase] ligase [Flavobacterium sp. RHBU_3]|uniref:biotin--[acetyl-CoA-carboxylase] ligase n=1 Tax=Flavobacterium sp. RHBU_3 TaxID=3391184 RepID=UPI0039849011